jgi:hypothetical protein
MFTIKKRQQKTDKRKPIQGKMCRAQKNGDQKISNSSQNPENPWAIFPEETAPPKIQGNSLNRA